MNKDLYAKLRKHLDKFTNPKPVQYKAPEGGLKRPTQEELLKRQALWQKMPPK